ncbi:MAG: diguanylate cyclase [Phycisphaeraceae bacterium]
MRPDAIDWDDKQGVSLAFVPRQRMHHILWRWMIAIALCQAGVALLVLMLLQGPWRASGRLDHAAAMATMAAGQIETATRAAGQGNTADVLDRLRDVQGIAFADVVDAEGALLASDEPLPDWAQTLIEDDRDTQIQTLHNRIVFRQPLESGDGQTLLLAVDDLGSRRAMFDGAAGMAAGLLIAALVLLPIAYAKLRRWTVGLAHLHQAIRRLAEGADPKPLPVGGDNEIAYLAIAFNDMAGQLLANRRALLEINQDLERRIASRTEDLRQAAEQLEKMATSDVLTGLPNRRALANGMEMMFAASTRSDADLVCLAIDLDGLKTINDTLGHGSGDELLKLAGEAFRAVRRSSDLVARLGGDEFVLLMTATGPEDAIPVSERLLQTFHELCAERFDEATIAAMPSMSIGIASRKQTGSETGERLLQEADKALYRAKHAGKARFEVWQSA